MNSSQELEVYDERGNRILLLGVNRGIGQSRGGLPIEGSPKERNLIIGSQFTAPGPLCAPASLLYCVASVGRAKKRKSWLQNQPGCSENRTLAGFSLCSCSMSREMSQFGPEPRSGKCGPGIFKVTGTINAMIGEVAYISRYGLFPACRISWRVRDASKGCALFCAYATSFTITHGSKRAGNQTVRKSPRIKKIASRSNPSHVMGIALLRTHNPLVVGSNPTGPTSAPGVQPGYIGDRTYRLHR